MAERQTAQMSEIKNVGLALNSSESDIIVL